VSSRDYDLIVVGGGAGGMAAARAAAARGARALLVQSGPIGGECTFTGCVPSKALIAAAARGKTFDQAMATVHHAVETIASTEDDEVFAREGIDVIHGWACFRTPTELDVDGTRLRGRRFVIATGTHPAVPPVEGIDTVDYLTSDNVFDLDARPASLAVLGGGAIGCELAQAFAHLGTKVTVVEALDRLLPREEPEASTAIAEVFAASGIDVRVGRTLTRVDALETNDAVLLHLDDQSVVSADRLLVAVGRRGAIDGVGLDAAGVATAGGFVVTDDRLATSRPGIWAVGDVAGKVQFTHAADEMGRIAAGNALSPRWRRHRFDATTIPWVIFTTPEVARVGMAETEAAEHGGRVAFLPMSEVDRAVVTGQTAGFVKLIAAPRRVLRGAGGGRILGATIVAARAGEMIHEPALAMRTGMFTGRLAQTVHAYPTWSVAIRQAAAQFFVEVGGRRARQARRDPGR
jgi:pyruvate/2-oxoglutarate dehydrogenase complex dihydrolipoamide dehydrogenase (E3) component